MVNSALFVKEVTSKYLGSAVDKLPLPKNCVPSAQEIFIKLKMESASQDKLDA